MDKLHEQLAEALRELRYACTDKAERMTDAALAAYDAAKANVGWLPIETPQSVEAPVFIGWYERNGTWNVGYITQLPKSAQAKHLYPHPTYYCVAHPLPPPPEQK